MATIRIACAMQKGGVGKTSTIVNLADALRRFGYRILVIDLDPQANACRILGTAAPTSVSPCVTELILNSQVQLKETINASKIPDVSVVYSNIKLAAIDHRLRNPEQYPQPLQQLQRKLSGEIGFDFILIDCPPSLSLLTMNGLAASDYLIVPMESGSQFSFDGVEDLLDILRIVQTVQPAVQLLGVVVTKHDRRQNVCKAVFSTITDKFGEDVFKTTITSSTSARKAEFGGVSVIQFDRKSTASKDYMDLARELLGRLGLKPLRQTSDLERQAAVTEPETASPTGQ